MYAVMPIILLVKADAAYNQKHIGIYCRCVFDCTNAGCYFIACF